MSRQIDWTQPLSDEDHAWASQFSKHDPLIQLNREQFTQVDNALAGEADDGGEVPSYDDTAYWTKAKLAEEISNRDLAMPAKAKREDLVAILEADDDAAEQA